MEKYLDETLSVQERAEALTDAMTVEEQASQLRYDAPEIKRLGIPAYNWWNEGLHGLARSGTATMFPQAIGLAAMFDTKLVEKAGEITSEETRAKYAQYAKHGDRDIYKGLTQWTSLCEVRVPSRKLTVRTKAKTTYLRGFPAHRGHSVKNINQQKKTSQAKRKLYNINRETSQIDWFLLF